MLLFVTATVLIGITDGENATGIVMAFSLLDSTLVGKYTVEVTFLLVKVMVLA